MFIHNIDSVALQIGPVAIRWYGLAYIAGILGAWLLGRHRAKRSPRTHPANIWRPDDVDNLIILSALGLVLGARLGYIIFYDFSYYLHHPLAVFKVWEGGMSFHGGMIGLIAAVFYFARQTRRSFFQVGDFIAPLVPLGLLAGRIGNFINGELWGSVTSMPWGVVFKGGGPLPRHPSQIYEALLEGLILGLALWLYSAKPHIPGRVCGMFLLGYGIFRFAVEFVRMPDTQLGYLAFGWLTMGQLLCIPMLLIGGWWLFRPVQTPKSMPSGGRTDSAAKRGRKKQ
ncbi:MAG: prolipoprotein diacylglyceryl transferase [Desulfovibrionaceae bacterium]|nr:prolipoprotein diacylglyceryl transferase [Desulfovibrionaceae bacterium]